MKSVIISEEAHKALRIASALTGETMSELASKQILKLDKKNKDEK